MAACHSLNGLDEHEAWREVGLIVGGGPRPAGLAARHVGLPPLPRPRLPERLPGRRLREGPGHRDRQAPRRPVLRLPVLHARLPLRRPQVPRGQGDRPEVRHVLRPAQGRRGAGLRPGLPARGDQDPRGRRAEAVAVAESNTFLPDRPGPDYTMPTTRYLSTRPMQGPVRAGDHFRNEPEHAHSPLVVMLVLTQASAGGFLVELAARATGQAVPAALAAAEPGDRPGRDRREPAPPGPAARTPTGP